MRLEPLEMMNECVAKCSTRLQYFERGRGGNVDVVLDRVLRDCRQSLELVMPLPSPISFKPPAVVGISELDTASDAERAANTAMIVSPVCQL